MATVSETSAIRPASFFQVLRDRRRVVGALLMRELHTRYGRENIGYLWLILEPLLLASMIAILHARSTGHYTSDIKPVPLALIGYCNFMTFRAVATRSEGAIENNASLFYHRRIGPFDLLLSRALLEAAGTFMAMAILMGLAVAVGVANLPARPLIYLLGIFLMFWISFGMSMVICGLTHERRAVGRIVHPITYILLPLSGAFFQMKYLPSIVRDVMLYIPLAHIFEILRYGWFKSASPDYIDAWYLGAWLLGSTVMGLLLLSAARQRIQL